jgi:type III restriction enzyme
MITRLLAVESVDEPTEIVIHVNMLKEGWDVTNLYTIVPLRAANARTLIEQSPSGAACACPTASAPAWRRWIA